MQRAHQGFTLLEILIVISIFAIIAAIVTASFSRYTRAQVITSTTTTIVSALSDARSRTLSSREGSQYGVHLENGSVTLFKGDTYDSGSPDNGVTSLDPRADIATALNGGGADIVFERLSGETTDHGTVVVSLTGDASIAKTITIQQTGLLSYDE